MNTGRGCGYSEPEPITPQDEAAELQREFIAGVNRLELMAAKIIRAQGKPRG